MSVPMVFQEKYIPSLNGLRAISILLVIITHLQFTADSPRYHFFLTYVANGNFGVQVFFVISGFLITGLLLKEKVRDGSINIKKFYARRAIRIFPVFYFYIVVILLLKILSIISLPGNQVLVASIYLQNFAPESWTGLLGHTWSLAVEEQYYLLWPIALCVLPGKYYLPVLFILLYNIFLRPYYYLHHTTNLFLLKGFLLYAPAILFGALLAISLFKNWLKKIHHILMYPLFAFSLPVAMAVYLPRTFLIMSYFSVPFDYIISSFFIALFIYHIVHARPGRFIYVLLNQPVINWIGILSYSIYIWQQLFLVPANVYQIRPWWTLWPQNIFLVLSAACISYYLVEKPLLSFKKYFQ